MVNEFIQYLNTLHSYHGHNSNVFGEKNITSQYYDQLLVDVPLCDYIIDKMSDGNPKIIMLTGHAGDGKTSLMYQVLKKLNCSFDSMEQEFEVSLPSGYKCLCIKDFSEFPDDKRIEIIRKSKEYQDAGQYVFMVANTGPLINSFVQCAEGNNKEDVESRFIDALDNNLNDIITINGYKLCIINIVKTENIYFANDFLKKILHSEEWKKCQRCEKNQFCHIFRNRHLMLNNEANTLDFIKKHYIWLNEYGKRLTIRNMTQQLAFMLTGGFDCETIRDEEPYRFLYSNLFFGYIGSIVDPMTLNIMAIKEAYECKYEEKRLRIDEDLSVKEDYDNLFSKEIADIIRLTITQNGHPTGFNEMFKRMYFFFNTQTNHDIDDEDIFSKQFDRYVDIKYNGKSPNTKDNNLIRSALHMIYTGGLNTSTITLPITLNRESGYTQNVQFVIDDIKLNKIQLKTVKSMMLTNLNNQKYELYISIGHERLNQEITLPLFDYFEDLKNGIINTNIDAQLSKGIENIKAEILDVVLDDLPNENTFALIVMNSDGGYEQINLTLEEGKISK